MSRDQPEQWEAGRLLQQAREELGITKVQAAKRIGMSESWWRKAELGWHRINGEIHPIRISPERLSRAAHLVGIPPRRILKAAGYTSAEDRAKEPTLRQLIHDQLDWIEDDDLPAVKAFLDGFLAGQEDE